jgi:hypothetical protein
MKRILIAVVLAASSAAWAQSGAVAKDCEQTPGGARILGAAAREREEAAKRVDELEKRDAKAAQAASSCLSRAGDNIVRAAIPPSIGSILGVLSDPGGYIQNATSNAACNVVSNEANKVAREARDVNGAVRRAGSDADRAFRGGVDGALGGQGGSYGQYSGQPPPKDQSFYQTMSCRIFGRC